MKNSIIHPIVIVSDGTGITARSLITTLISQFPSIEDSFHETIFSHVRQESDIKPLSEQLYRLKKDHGSVMVVITITNRSIREMVVQECQQKNVHIMDILGEHLPLFEQWTGHTGLTRDYEDYYQGTDLAYNRRIEASLFAVDNDDGVRSKNYAKADVILLGPSRSGKTPTCLYLGLHFGILAANFPLVLEDNPEVKRAQLPDSLAPHHHKLVGLYITPEKMHSIRQKRRPNSFYSSYDQCLLEFETVKRLYMMNDILAIDATNVSIEEIASRCIQLIRKNN